MEYISGLTSDLSPRGSIGTVALAKDWGGWGVLVRKESLSTAPRVHTHFKKPHSPINCSARGWH